MVVVSVVVVVVVLVFVFVVFVVLLGVFVSVALLRTPSSCSSLSSSSLSSFSTFFKHRHRLHEALHLNSLPSGDFKLPHVLLFKSYFSHLVVFLTILNISFGSFPEANHICIYKITCARRRRRLLPCHRRRCRRCHCSKHRHRLHHAFHHNSFPFGDFKIPHVVLFKSLFTSNSPCRSLLAIVRRSSLRVRFLKQTRY